MEGLHGLDEQKRECKQELEKLVGKKILEIDFRTYNNECWRVYLNTDKGKMVMTFCKKWSCPVVEMREDASFKEDDLD